MGWFVDVGASASGIVAQELGVSPEALQNCDPLPDFGGGKDLSILRRPRPCPLLADCKER